MITRRAHSNLYIYFFLVITREKYSEKASISIQNVLCRTSKQLSAIHFLITTYNVCPRGDPRNLCANARIRLLATSSFLLTRVSLSYLVLVPAHFLTLHHLLFELLVVALARWPLERKFLLYFKVIYYALSG